MLAILQGLGQITHLADQLPGIDTRRLAGCRRGAATRRDITEIELIGIEPTALDQALAQGVEAQHMGLQLTQPQRQGVDVLAGPLPGLAQIMALFIDQPQQHAVGLCLTPGRDLGLQAVAVAGPGGASGGDQEHQQKETHEQGQ
ncbi:MAG: hypothetical protein AB2813_12180 [Candidatus Sedimenticola endophacoides]